jgi:hypothetical protein
MHIRLVQMHQRLMLDIAYYANDVAAQELKLHASTLQCSLNETQAPS